MKHGLALLALLAAFAGCKAPCNNNLPPSQMLMHPGPGVDGPGPGVMDCPVGTTPMSDSRSQVAFVGPEGMVVSWDVSAPGHFDSEPLICPGRYNFPQGAIYRLKLTNIPGRPGAELYPTLEIGPTMPRTAAFLGHNAIPVQFTEEDLDQVHSGNFVTKVIYLPDPEFQELALAGIETLVSTRLDPGVDPIVEADRRGAILAVVRLGNKDLEMPSEMIGQGEVVQTSYGPAQASALGTPLPTGSIPAGTIPRDYISGVTGPQYGMPSCGTPIGLPGPPHIPLGIPAGLRKHAIKNHTHHRIPGPTKRVRIDVLQEPGFSYPKPANHACIVEKAASPFGILHQPFRNKIQCVNGGPQCADRSCPTECPVGAESTGSPSTCGEY